MSARETPRKLLALALTGAAFAALLSGCGHKGADATPAPATNSKSAPATEGAKPTPPATPAKPQLPRIAPDSTLEPPSWDGFEALPSFTYHHVDPKLKNNIAITPATFESELKILSNLGYHTVTARQVVEHQSKGTPLPSKPVMITFDDGWRNQYTFAYPLLKKYGFTATFFINPQPISGGYRAYLTRGMVEEMSKAGNDIESHTWRHLRVTRARNETADFFQNHSISELTRANAWIKTVTGQAPVALCYPFGYYDLEAVGLAQATGLKAGFTVDEGVADARSWDAWGMKRFTISNIETTASFKRRLLSKPLPITNIQPAPASRVVGANTTVTVDISAVPGSVSDIHLTGGPSMHKMQIVTVGGKKIAQAIIRGGTIGFRAISMRGTGADGSVYYASWGLVTGDK